MAQGGGGGGKTGREKKKKTSTFPSVTAPRRPKIKIKAKVVVFA